MIVSSVAPPTKPVEVRAHRHPRLDLHADAVLRHAVDGGAPHVCAGRVDDLRVNAGADCFEHCLAGAFGGEIDRAGPVEIERDAGFVRGDKSEDDVPHIAAREIMGFEWVARDIDPGFDRGDAVIDDHSDRHFAQTHSEHLEQTYRRVCQARAQPKVEESKNDDADDENDERRESDSEKVERLHGGKVAEAARCGKFNRSRCCQQRLKERRFEIAVALVRRLQTAAPCFLPTEFEVKRREGKDFRY